MLDRLPLNISKRIQTLGDCWGWTGSKERNGYGRLGIKTDSGWRTNLAHRHVYELLVACAIA